MQDISVSQQVEEAIAMNQYWVSSYLSSFSQEALKHPFDAANALARLLSPFLTGIGSFILFLNYRNEKEKRAEEIERNDTEAKNAEARLMSERFSKAIEHIGSEKIHVRIGGIYSLETIAKDDPREHQRVIEILIAFIQSQHLSWSDPSLNPFSPTTDKAKAIKEKTISVMADIQASLTVLSRRNESKDRNNVDLSHAFLRKANLQKSKFKKASLKEANLREANFDEADLRGANLEKADLRDAALGKTKLQGAKLIGAKLAGAMFFESNFEGAELDFINYTPNGSNLN